MISLEDTDYIRKCLYPFASIGLLFFFFKMARHPEKSDGLLMILILTALLFITLVVGLLTVFYPNHGLLYNVGDVSGNFLNLWILFMAGCHYYALKRFKKKFKEIYFKSSMICAVILGLALASISNIKSLKSWNGDSILIDVLLFVTLGFISCNAYRFREEIRFGPYSVARESASKLIKFSSIQTFLSFLYLIESIIYPLLKCAEKSNSEPHVAYCAVWDLSSLVLFQVWTWVAVFFNWQMFCAIKNKEAVGSKFSSVMTLESTALLSSPV